MVKNMKNLFKLFFTKKKAKIRSMFSKPTSAITTLLTIAMFLAMFYPVLKTKGKDDLDIIMLSLFTLFLIIFSTGLNLITLFQKRQALFFDVDSYYLFVGPFSNKQILTYLSISTIFDAFIFALISSVIPMIMVSIATALPLTYILLAFLLSTLFSYCILLVLQYFYIKDMIIQKQGNTQKWLGLIIILILLAYAIYSYFKGSFDFGKLYLNFTFQNDFNWIPFLGWIRAAIFSFYKGKYFITLGMIALFVLVASILHILLINIKGYFYEQAMIDSLNVSEMYKKAMAGANTKEEKVHDSSIKYKSLSGAILSKNFLIMKKTRAFLSRQDIFSFIALVAFALILKPDAYIFFGLLVYYLMNSISNSSLIDDLKSNYIYLIPDLPIKKLLYSLLIPILKTTMFSILMILVGFIFLDLNLIETLIGILITLSFIPVFYCAIVLSIRLLKSRGNKLVESFVRMFVMIVICLPSAGITYLVFKLTNDLSQSMMVLLPTLILFNLALSTLTFYLCAPMLNGNAYIDE